MVPAEAELAPSKLAGAILTGGRSRRMGGGPKALQQVDAKRKTESETEMTEGTG
jgi:molybdopterin-guanine dinucleotide biosynthesis protein A